MGDDAMSMDELAMDFDEGEFEKPNLTEVEENLLGAKANFTESMMLFEEEDRQINKERQALNRARGSLYEFLYEHKNRKLTDKKNQLKATIAKAVMTIAADAKNEGFIEELEEACFEQNDFLQSLSLPITRVLS